MRRALAAAGSILLLTLVAACGADDTSSGDSGDGGDTASVEVLSEEDATTALLSETNLGELYAVVEQEDDEDDESSFGCLDALDDMEETGAPTEVDRTFEFEGDLGLPSIGSEVSSYESVDDATAAFETFRSALEGCESVDETDPEGTRTQLTVTLDDEISISDAEEQANLVATGTISGGGGEYPFGIFFTAARVGNHVTTVGIVELGDEVGGSIDEYTQVAVDRLTAVIAGEEPEDVTVDVAPVEGEAS